MHHAVPAGRATRIPGSRLPAPCLAAGLFLLMAFPTAGATQLPQEFPSAWDRIAASWRAELTGQGVVGASLALVHEGRLIRLETHGMADRETGRAVDEETIYHWASITKTFTAVAILQLRDRGLLSLDDPVVRYVPELRDVYNPFGPMEAITLRHLLSHSAGFRAGTWPWSEGAPWEPYEPTEWSQLVAMMPYTRILFPPGSRYSYSNPGIVFLGRVIEKVTGDVFEAHMEKNLFRPLGMRRTYFDMTPWHLLSHRSNHYFVRDGKPEPGGLDFNTGITVSNGGLNASIPDMARWLGFLMGFSPEGVDGGAILSRRSLEEMWRTVLPIGESEIGRESMGLSFFLYDLDGRRLVGHTGTQRAFYSFFIMDPEAKVAALGAFNTAGTGQGPPRTDELRVRTRTRVVREVFPLFRAGRAPAALPSESAMIRPAVLATNAFYSYRDLNAAWDFYTRVLGFETVADYGFAKILRVAATSYLTLVDASRGVHPADEPKTVTLALVTDQVEAWWKYLSELGVPMRAPLGTVDRARAHNGFVAVDPEGYLLEFERFNPHEENTQLLSRLAAVEALGPGAGVATARPGELRIQGTVLWLYYRDIEAALAWYERTLGTRLLVDQGWAKVVPVSSTGYLGFVDGSRGLHPASERKAVTVSFFTADAEGWFAALNDQPDFTLRTPEITLQDGRVRTVMGYDPEGYFLEWNTFLRGEGNRRLLALLGGNASSAR